MGGRTATPAAGAYAAQPQPPEPHGPARTGGVYREMVDEIMQQINWTEIAEDLVAQ